MSAKKKYLSRGVYILLMLAAILVLFRWYTLQNSIRIEKQNLTYAADSARQKAAHVEAELANALIPTHIFLGRVFPNRWLLRRCFRVWRKMRCLTHSAMWTPKA